MCPCIPSVLPVNFLSTGVLVLPPRRLNRRAGLPPVGLGVAPPSAATLRSVGVGIVGPLTAPESRVELVVLLSLC